MRHAQVLDNVTGLTLNRWIIEAREMVANDPGRYSITYIQMNWAPPSRAQMDAGIRPGKPLYSSHWY